MTKEDILRELPKLRSDERDELLLRLHELSEGDILHASETIASDAEKKLLDREWPEFQTDSVAGAPWPEVRSRLKNRK